MIPHCVRIRSSHLSCKNTENKGKRQYEENNTIISKETESNLFFPQVQDIKVTFIGVQSCLIRAARVKVLFFFLHTCTRLEMKVKNKNKEQTRGSFQSLKSWTTFAVLQSNFLHKLPVSYHCIWRSMRGGNFNEK